MTRAERAASKVLTKRHLHPALGESPIVSLGWLLGTKSLSYEEGLTALVEEAVSDAREHGGTPDFRTDRISKAFNRAADEVLDIADDGSDERLRDAINLVVTAGLHFLEHPDASLEDAVRENYDDDFAEELLDSLR